MRVSVSDNVGNKLKDIKDKEGMSIQTQVQQALCFFEVNNNPNLIIAEMNVMSQLDELYGLVKGNSRATELVLMIKNEVNGIWLSLK